MRTLKVVTIVAAAAALSVTAGCGRKESRQVPAPGEPVASAEAVPEETTEPASAPAETPAPAAAKKGKH